MITNLNHEYYPLKSIAWREWNVFMPFDDIADKLKRGSNSVTQGDNAVAVLEKTTLLIKQVYFLTDVTVLRYVFATVGAVFCAVAICREPDHLCTVVYALNSKGFLVDTLSVMLDKKMLSNDS